MPVRPDDFDSIPQRVVTPVAGAPALATVGDRKKRAEAERLISSTVGSGNGRRPPSSRTVLLLAVGIVLAWGTLEFRNPIQRLLKPRKPQVPVVLKTEGSSDPAAPVKPPVGLRETSSPPSSAKKPSPLHVPRGEQIRGEERRIEEKSSATRPLPDPTLEDAGLQREQAEIESEKKKLADQEKALEAERQAVAQQAARERDQELNHPQTQPLEKEKLSEASERASQPPPYNGPSSGTLEWEGDVAGAELIEIDNGNVSSGTLRGSLPGVPCMVQSSDPKKVSIATAPGPSNDWRRLVLRVKANGHTRVTVTWALP